MTSAGYEATDKFTVEENNLQDNADNTEQQGKGKRRKSVEVDDRMKGIEAKKLDLEKRRKDIETKKKEIEKLKLDSLSPKSTEPSPK